jgi:TonB family protein
MFGILLESSSRRRRRARVSAVSIAAHAVAITLASAATRGGPARMIVPDRAEAVIYRAAPTTAPLPRSSGGRVGSVGGASSPRGFKPLVGPNVSIDVDLPDPASPAGPIGEPIGTPSPGADGAGSVSSPDGSFAVVDRSARPLAESRARYPESLRQAGIEGEAILRFVVDSLGRVETPSVETVRSTGPAFAESARRALLSKRFLPAESGGRAVRQQLEQAYRFTLDR